MSVQKIACVCLCGWVGLSSPAHSRSWDSLYAFGDSYTDSGAGYIDGNGPTAVAYLATRLNMTLSTPRSGTGTAKGMNFAVSGAQTGKSDGVWMRPATAKCGSNEALLGRGMQTQVSDFSQRVKAGSIRFNPERTLFFLAGGLNDSDLPTETTIANLESQVRLLYELGGRYFTVALLPTKIPAFTAVGIRLNPEIAKIPKDLGAALPGAHIVISRWGEYFDRVIENPGDYGVRNTTDRCAGRALFGEDPTPCPAPDTYFYFHEGHPSTAVHRLVATELKRELAAAYP